MRRVFHPKVVLVLLIALLCSACGASARTTALRGSLVALNVARDTMLTVSKEREAQIVEHATSKEEGRAQLDTWRASIDKVAAAIDDGYRLIYGAAILDDVKSANDAGAAVQKALVLLKGLKDLKDLKNPTPPSSPATKEPTS